MDHVTRINLKTDCGDKRQELVDFCLHNEDQYLVIGWSYIYDKNKDIKDYHDFYCAVKDNVSRMNHALNVFSDAKTDDLFWTRDLDGNYWICRATGEAQIRCDLNLDIGSVLPIRAFKVGLQVPGQIKASFNRHRGGIAEGIYDDIILEYSKHIYNELSGTKKYDITELRGSILDNLPDFDLEELIICYLQIVENYYLLSNSIANKSTTIKIECELMGRDKCNRRKAVLQVKGGKTKDIDALDYKEYANAGYIVYLYAPVIKNIDLVSNCIAITKETVLNFYNEYKTILPESITKWEKLY